MSLFTADISINRGKQGSTTRVKVIDTTTIPVMYLGAIRQVPAYIVERMDATKEIYVQPAVQDGAIIKVSRVSLT